jgi:hypothetical protein
MTSTRTLAAQLYHQLWLEVEHLQADIAYEAATSFCSDCPHRNWDDWYPQSYSEMEFGVRIAETCCKDDPDHWAAETEHIKVCEQIMALLKTFAGDEELAAAQAKITEVQK